jgi:hypothetical protein
MKAHLEQAAEMFVPSAAARCLPVSVKLESPVLQPGSKPTGDGHADLDGEFVFRCENPTALRDLEVGLFQRFPKLKTLDVQVAGARGQSAAKLSPKQRRITW